MKNSIKIISLIICAICTQAYSQLATESSYNLENKTQQKKNLTPEDYKLWGKLSGHKISNNGEWYTYGLTNESKLYVAATKADTKYTFPYGYKVEFSAGSKWFGCIIPDKGLGLLNLETGNIHWTPKVSKFKFLKGHTDKYLIAYRGSTSATELSSLLIMDLITGKQESIPGVIEYQINPRLNSMVYIVDSGEKKRVLFRTIEASPKTTVITENGVHTYKKLLWSTDGTALTFLQEAEKGLENQKRYKLYHYNKKQKGALKCLDPIEEPSLFGGMDITGRSLKISEDGGVVFFDIIGKEERDIRSKASLPVDVQVWNTKDKRIYPKLKDAQKYGKAEFGSFLTAWWPSKDKTMMLETKVLPEVIVSTNMKYILSFNGNAYAPHFKYKGDIDLYLTNLETGEQRLFLKRQELGEFGSNSVGFSPEGKYIHYFRDKHWWVYDLKEKTHTNITQRLDVQLYETIEEGAHPSVLEPYENRGRSLYWTHGDKELVIYDRYDTWLISPEGKARRVTEGKEKQVRYRIDKRLYTGKKKTIDTSEELVFSILNTKTMASGYAIWNPKKGLETLVYKDMRIDGLKKARDGEVYMYREQSFRTSPRLMYHEKGMPDARILVESNPQQKKFYWGHAELIHYTNSEGQELKGALFYPANYKIGKKYPMVVHVYEQRTQFTHYYLPPTEYNSIGFNRTNYSADGYFVFLPDIKYQYNDPGISALHCVEAGVKAVLEKGIVEKDHIGLTGQSFGGYETAFIVTQTDMFAAAIAGAAFTDLISEYHVLYDGVVSKIFGFENNQNRYTDSFYQNPDAYLRNSTLHHAAGINTPLLLWAGKKDLKVLASNAIKLHLGLRRLGKESTLLFYPHEGHSISHRHPDNQVDLTRRMKAWFDKYLKPN